MALFQTFCSFKISPSSLQSYLLNLSYNSINKFSATFTDKNEVYVLVFKISKYLKTSKNGNIMKRKKITKNYTKPITKGTYF